MFLHLHASTHTTALLLQEFLPVHFRGRNPIDGDNSFFKSDFG
jgi:hypothetical protein